MFGIGVDIVEVKRFDRLKENESFLKKVFTEKEMAYCLKKKAASECLAVRFAAKEAFAKALGTGFTKGIHFNEIEILKDENGKPYFILYNTTKEYFDKLSCKNIHLSLSHERSHAVAMVVIE
ncbi:MAG: holo-[acyl-carrier-protein] synthase [Spirochaetes bacterium GWD1_27_9]|nr:MAG: holo-[acyl-carrier-protein] synthase [Spirochaetes bacterium GWB1_27_13]OHD28294.1 MAG: holo-[acyl-carrier-protein] synthase [Spirochaetes bacterium GWC1_27_15]OHD35061.1 MAG: holo-[acyl-carrier-protein] synthase [Spirochaetes bacterium GWD1_27_9]